MSIVIGRDGEITHGVPVREEWPYGMQKTNLSLNVALVDDRVMAYGDLD